MNQFYEQCHESILSAVYLHKQTQQHHKPIQRLSVINNTANKRKQSHDDVRRQKVTFHHDS